MKEGKSINYLHIPTENNNDVYGTSNKEVYAWVAQVITAIQKEGATPILVHCRSGKDRTGVIIATLLKYLGVPDDVIVAEYLLNERTKEEYIRTALAGLLQQKNKKSEFAIDAEIVVNILTGEK